MSETELPAGEPANSTASWTQEQWDDFHYRLEQLNDECGSAGKEDRARVLAAFCIGEGINIVGRIINALVPLGFDNQHIGALLTKDKGGWFRVGPGNVVTYLNG